jgi:hypothetical protein
VSSTSGAGDPRPSRFFDRFTEPLADRAREKIAEVEDKVRAAIQGEIDAVMRSVRSRAVEIRPSAIAFGSAAVLTFFGIGLLLTSAVLGLSHVLDPWLAALLVGVAVILIAGGLAAYGRHRLPPAVLPRVGAASGGPVAGQEPVDEVHPWAD